MKKLAAFLLICATVICSLPAFSVHTNAVFTGTDKINIVLDPGHGGSNVGASARGVGEKTYAFRLAGYLKTELEANGNFNVYLTRTGDYDLELYERAEVADSYNADLLISLHFDGNPSPSMNGTTAYTSVFDSYALVSLSGSITSNISSAIGLYNNGVKRRQDNEGYYWNFDKQWDCQDPSLGTLSDYYGIPTWCAKFGIPSTIIEHGFFSSSSDVNKLFADGALEKIAKAEAQAIISYYTNHTHVYSAAVQDYPSNCVYTGKQSEHCSVCNHRRNVQSLAPAPDNHYWVTKESVAASCGTDGKVVKECRISQNLTDKGWTGGLHTQTDIIPAPSDHSFVMVENVASTHTEDGYQSWKCSTCSFSFKEVFEAEGHSFEFAGYTAPTCTESGGNLYKCTVCSYSYTDIEAAKGHSFTVSSRTDPTCTEEGCEERTCTVCSHSETESLAPTGHTLPDDATVAPTCTEDGYRRGICLSCEETIDETLPMTGHSFETTREEPATCENGGNLTRVCTVCSYTEEMTNPPLGHSYEVISSTAPTCETAGVSSLKCTLCEATSTEEIPPLGHKKSETAINGGSGTSNSGSVLEYPCENGCGKIFTEEIPPQLSKKDKIIIMGSFATVIAGILAAVVFIILKKANKDKVLPPPSPADTEGDKEKQPDPTKPEAEPEPATASDTGTSD